MEGYKIPNQIQPVMRKPLFNTKPVLDDKREKLKKLLSWFFKIYFILFTTSGFVMFICEEAMQMSSFGAFAYNSAKDGYGLRMHIKQYMQPTQKASEIIIYGIGWLNPIMFPAYMQYLRVNAGYIKAANANANALIQKDEHI